MAVWKESAISDTIEDNIKREEKTNNEFSLTVSRKHPSASTDVKRIKLAHNFFASTSNKQSKKMHSNVQFNQSTYCLGGLLGTALN